MTSHRSLGFLWLALPLVAIPLGSLAVVRLTVRATGCGSATDCPDALSVFAFLWAFGAITIPIGVALALVGLLRHSLANSPPDT